MAGKQLFRLVSTALVIAVASAGCIGSTGSTGTVITSGPVPGLPATDVFISYNVPTCPPGAKCLTAPGESYYIVSRHLTCSPDGGDYDDPAAVCRALADLVTKRDADPRASYACSCPALPRPLAKAFGFYHGKRRTIPLDACSLCQLRGIGADISLLMP
jgi:hypothetical protein